METFIEIIKQIGVAVATIFLACPIFILFVIEYIERWDKKKQNNKNEIEKIQKEREERQQRIDEIRQKRLAIEEEIARIDSFTRSNHDYIKEQQKIHFPDKFK